MTLSDFLLFAFTLVGLFLVPAALGRAAWAVPAGLAGVGLVLFFAPASLHPAVNPWVHLTLSQGPWILLVLDLAFRGRINRVLEPVSMRALIAFSLFRFMGARFVFSAINGDLMPTFAVQAASGELLTALGALLLWALYRPATRWYRVLLILWNTYGLWMALGLNFCVLRADPGLPFAGGYASREVHRYFSIWPNGIDAYFWMPLAICIHAAIFFALLRPKQE